MSALARHEQDWLTSAVGSSVRDFYTEIGVEVTASATVEAMVRCFANPQAHTRDDRRASCSLNLLTGLWKCHGCGEQGNAFRAAVLSGRSEWRAAELARSHGLFSASADARDVVSPPRLPSWPTMRKWQRALRADTRMLRRLYELRGWTAQAIWRLGLGWDGERIVFPVRSPRLKIIGVARYLPGGSPKMVSLPGSKRDLFPPPEVVFPRREPLFLVEGEPDCVAVWSAGRRAVAVPGAQSWRNEWAQRLLGRRVVVLADCDRPGRELAERVVGCVPGARVVDLDVGRDDGWDVGSLVGEASREGGLGQVDRLLGGLAA